MRDTVIPTANPQLPPQL